MKLGHARLLVFLLLGAMLNIFVAWRYSCYGKNRADFEELNKAEASDAWEDFFGAIPDDPSFESSILRSFGYTHLLISYLPESQDSIFTYKTLVIHRVGIPFSSLQYIHYVTNEGGPDKTSFEDAVGFRSPYIGSFPILGRAAFPYGVRPLEFSLNTIFYAALVWGVSGLFGKLRRRTRLDGKCCPECRYDLRVTIKQGIDVTCSECGQQIPALLLKRPRQILRLWMLPFLAGPLLFGGLFFVGQMSWSWLAFNMRYVHSPLGRLPLITLSVSFCLILTLACRAYVDRDKRTILAVFSAIILTILGFLPLYLAIIRLSNPAWWP